MKTIVTIPTYNESENIGKLIDKIFGLKIKNLEVLVIDDNSPDGTWRIVKDIAKKNNKVRLLLRKTGRGRGLAGRAGFVQALKMGADYIIEMDADFSHDPKYIPALLDKMNKYDVVLGSRAVKGGKDFDRNIARKVISKLAAFYIRAMLGLRVKNPTSGYRCFKRQILERIKVGKLKATGPFIITEVLYKCHQKGARICEVPIIFRDRKLGSSKLGLGALINNLYNVLKLRINS